MKQVSFDNFIKIMMGGIYLSIFENLHAVIQKWKWISNSIQNWFTSCEKIALPLHCFLFIRFIFDMCAGGVWKVLVDKKVKKKNIISMWQHNISLQGPYVPLRIRVERWEARRNKMKVEWSIRLSVNRKNVIYMKNVHIYTGVLMTAFCSLIQNFLTKASWLLFSRAL